MATLETDVPFKTPYDQNAVTMVAHKDLLIYSGLEQGTVAIRVAKDGSRWKTEEVWRNKEVPMYLSSPVIHGNLLFGMTHKNKGQLFSLDASTGRTLWKNAGGLGENASILNGDSLILVLSNNADLIFVEPGEKECKVVAEYKVASTPTWAHPLILESRVLIKDKTTLASLKL